MIQRRCFALLAAAAATGAEPNTDTRARWPQWGGPNRNFTVETAGLADTWPEDGPRKLWYRKLGDGYSSIVVDSGSLFTMYRKTHTDAYERIIALDAATGSTLWEHRVPSRRPGRPNEWPFGPNSTPLVLGERLYVTTAHAVLHCLNKTDGKVLWERSLGGKPATPLPDGYGYSISPILHDNTVIVAAGCDGDGVTCAERSGRAEGGAGSARSALVGLDPQTGDVLWTGDGFVLGHSSPIVITFEGEDQLVLFAEPGLFGFDPKNGDKLWQFPVEHNVTNDAIVTPLWDGGDLLFCASHGTNSGGRVVRLRKEGQVTVPEEAWFSRKAFFGNLAPARVGDHLIGAKGQFMTSVDMRTGRIAWREREFEGAKCLWADGKLITLDLNGELGLSSVTSDGLSVRSRCQLTERVSLTPPTLVGTTLYLRDRKHITALDLGTGATDG